MDSIREEENSMFDLSRVLSQEEQGTEAIRSPSLIEEMTEAMALSMLIFLLADLRLMSCTGRVHTKFETLLLESDLIPRTSADRLAGLSPNSAGKKEANRKLVKEGLSPAQLMAILFIEMKIEFDAIDQRNQEKTQQERSESSAHVPRNPIKAKAHHLRGSDFLGWGFERSKRSKRAKKLKREWESEMHKLLRAYAQMIGNDIKKDMPQIEAKQSLLEVVDQNQNRYNTYNDIGMTPSDLDDAISEGNNSQPLTNNPKITERVRDRRKSAMVQFNEKFQETKQKLEERTKTIKAIIVNTEAERDLDNLEQVTDKVFTMAKKEPNVRKSVLSSISDASVSSSTAYSPRVSRTSPVHSATDGGQQQRDAEGLEAGIKDALGGSQENETLSANQMLQVLMAAVGSRVYEKLDFMEEFFRPGTISQLMVQSKARVIWVNDWHQSTELTYALATDVTNKRLIVFFRGAITLEDWRSAFDRDIDWVDNPIAEDFPGKTDRIRVHRGFYRYLFRSRKDTGTTKFDEIVSMAYKYGMEKIGPGFHLVVNGHSLGAALSTVFSLFASADARLTRNGPIKVFTFGSPYVGGHDFADCFRYQEESGRLRYARFYNHNDFVAFVPENFEITSRGSTYRHVGVGVKIPPCPKWFTTWRKWSPRVFYVGNEGCFRAYRRAIARNFLLRSPWVWQIAKMHTLAEMQKRVTAGKEQCQGDQKSSYQLLNLTIEELYKELAGMS